MFISFYHCIGSKHICRRWFTLKEKLLYISQKYGYDVEKEICKSRILLTSTHMHTWLIVDNKREFVTDFKGFVALFFPSITSWVLWPFLYLVNSLWRQSVNQSKTLQHSQCITDKMDILKKAIQPPKTKLASMHFFNMGIDQDGSQLV